ncbi:phage holin, LL-H family [Streptococcus pneumoniae]|uniref:phage holin n=1 Tax=Streptococcus pneumoniae TaxID=1313 RepID=UPI0010E949B4|nr:phage holin [Streptococcus pneumoniae]MDY6753364.1 phage holin [Streptococcus pneumoniae]VKJ69519.1 phage holin, LL-H family [Streptococcus pneumoniae]VMK38681.1 phage holin, LL-H family [Streptococcus pneumoniae]VNS28830.1 phage holin, LL-H family [Streptococcus pneumoniae]VPN59349.1 phage holin, LL-H family [Streptococcus pneumoniae]
MQQITEIIIASATGILTVLAGIAVKSIKDFLIKKGGEKTIKIVEILAKNAVNAVEQVAQETGFKGEEKLEQARTKIRAELNKYNISMTDHELDTFIEASVKEMNDAWKGDDANV